MSDLLFVKDIIDGVPERSQVRDSDIDYTGLGGFKTRSTTTLTIQDGLQYMVLDADDDRLRPGMMAKVQTDRDNWMKVVVMEKDYTSLPVRIRFLTLRRSPVISTASEWEFSLDNSLFNMPPNAVLGFSATSMTVPSEGQSVSLIVEGADLVNTRNVHALVFNANNFSDYYRMRLTDNKNLGTNEIVGVVTDRDSVSGDTVTAWLVMLIVGPVSGGSAQPATAVKQAEATSVDSTTIVAPADIQAGDLLVLLDRVANLSTPATAVPAGFSVISNVTLADPLSPFFVARAILSAKIADGSEASATLTGMTYGEEAAKVLVVFRPDVPAASFNVGDVSGEITNGNPSPQTISAAAGTVPLIVLGAYGSASSISPRTFTVGGVGAKDGEADSANVVFIAWKIYSAAPADVVIDMDDEGSLNSLQGCYIELRGLPPEPGDSVVFEDDGSGGPMYAEGDGSQITNLNYNNISNPPTATAAASQAEQEAASATNVYVSPGRQHYHPAHPKAIYSATVTPTAITGAATSWDTTADTCLWNAAHDLTTGDTFIPVTNAPAGTTNLTPYYVNVVSTTVFSLHTTLADALAGTNKVNITSSTLTTARRLVYSDVISYGMSSVSPVTGVAVTAALGLVFNLGTVLSSAAALCDLNVKGLDTTAGANLAVACAAYPTVATKVITYANANIIAFSSSGTATLLDTWSSQGTTPFSVSFKLYGDHP